MGPLKKVFLGVYWNARRENLDECTLRLSQHFIALSAASPDMTVWFKKVSKKGAAPKEFDLSSRAKIRALLEAGTNKRDLSREVIEELGYSLSAWNGGLGSSTATTLVKCGMYIDNPNLSNVANVEINFKEAMEFNWEELFGRLMEIWSPQNGKVSLLYGDGQSANFRYENRVRKMGLGSKASPQFGGFMIAE